MMRLSIGGTALCVLFVVGNVSAQIVSSDVDTSCKDSGGVMITITDPSGAVIPNAFVLFRADGLGTAKSSKGFLLERRTDATGKQIVSVPCGLVDLFTAADGFAPHTEKILVKRDITLVSVKLEVYPSTQY